MQIKCFDQMQTTLSSAESVFSLLQTLSLNTLRDVNTVDAKQTNNRSADDLKTIYLEVLKNENQKLNSGCRATALYLLYV